jgi:hypothetical protein
MQKAFVVSLLVFLLSACNGTAKDYVIGVNPNNGRGPDSATPPLTANGPTALKISQGNQLNTGSSLAFQSTVTPTNRLVKSGSMSAQLTVHRERVSP